MIKTILIFINLILFNFIFAEDINTSLEENKIIILENKIKSTNKDLIYPKVFNTEFKDLYAVVDSKNIFFTNYNNDFYLVGDLYKNKNNKFEGKNIKYRSLYYNYFLSNLNKSKLYKYQAKEEKTYIYVFSDPTCPYCKRLHENLDFFLEKGISIYYIPFPRNGKRDIVSTKSLTKIICSSNPAEEYNKAFLNVKQHVSDFNKKDSCEEANIMWEYYNLANILNIKGTPAVFTSNSYLVGGFNNKFSLLKNIEEAENYGN